MCRVLGYIGPPVLLADLVTRPKNSLINQSFDAEYHDMLQLAGSGFAAWRKGSPDEPPPAHPNRLRLPNIRGNPWPEPRQL